MIGNVSALFCELSMRDFKCPWNDGGVGLGTGANPNLLIRTCGAVVSQLIWTGYIASYTISGINAQFESGLVGDRVVPPK